MRPCGPRRVQDPAPHGHRSNTEAIMSLNSSEFRKAMGCFATGVTIITVDLEGVMHGMTANAFASVSLDPPLVLVCVDHKTRTHATSARQETFRDQRARRGPAGDLRLLRAHRAHATRTPKPRRGRGLTAPSTELRCCMDRWRTWSAGCARRKWPGDHTIFIAEVEDVVVREGEPLLFFRGKYRKVGEDVGNR